MRRMSVRAPKSEFSEVPLGVENMIQMDNLTEETLLQNLHVRYEGERIYVRNYISSGFADTTPNCVRCSIPNILESFVGYTHFFCRPMLEISSLQ
jgi:hypothetical protein